MFRHGRLPLRHSLFLFVALVFTGVMALALPANWYSSVFAASLQPDTIQTCARVARADDCDGQDPERQGCAKDAVTQAQVLIRAENSVVGRVERRFSKTCSSWWGRVIDTRPGAHDWLSIQVDGYVLLGPPQFADSQYRILYSMMRFNAPPLQAPKVIGLFEINRSPIGPSATIPAAAQ